MLLEVAPELLVERATLTDLVERVERSILPTHADRAAWRNRDTLDPEGPRARIKNCLSAMCERANTYVGVLEETREQVTVYLHDHLFSDRYSIDIARSGFPRRPIVTLSGYPGSDDYEETLHPNAFGSE